MEKANFTCPECHCTNLIQPRLVVLTKMTLEFDPGARALRFTCPTCDEITDAYVLKAYRLEEKPLKVDNLNRRDK